MPEHVKCLLCKGTGKNKTGVKMRVNNEHCPRCGGYGYVPTDEDNTRQVNASDQVYIRNNGIVLRSAT